METVAGVIGFKVTEGTRHPYMRLATAKVSIFSPSSSVRDRVILTELSRRVLERWVIPTR